MKKIKYTILLLVLITIQIVSCSKKDIQEDDEKIVGETGLTLADQVSLTGTGDEFGTGIISTVNGFIICGVTTDDKPYIIAIDNNHNVLWEKAFVTMGVGGFEKIIQTRDGNYVVTGFVETTFRDFDLDVFAVKITATGETLWEKALGFNYVTDTTMDMIETSNGDIVIGATKISEPIPSDIRDYSNEVLVLKINTSGELIWSKIYGDSDGNKKFASLIEEANGDILIGGSYSYQDPESSGNSIANMKSELLLFRINSTGEIIEEKRLSTFDNQSAARLHRLKSGEIIVLSGKPGATQNDRDVWLFTINNTLEIARETTIGGNGLDIAKNMVENDANELFLVGDTDSHIVKDDTNLTYPDVWVVKVSSSFTVLGELTLGGSDFDAASEVIIKDDRLVIVGSTASNDGDVLVNNGAWDIWVTFVDDIE